ncbi:HEPN domain-containing protein [Ferroglobus placidus]|uniref:HEPN domain-containing protein n=1 Tax=Ferroglobus placidus TaxID=54261 RepID=UPI00064EB95C|nr:HEPN domain-containing protein [Ferroglobus placidus]
MKKGTKEMLDLVEENIVTARKSAEIGLYRSACFWAQQAIELVLKAFLAENDALEKKSTIKTPPPLNILLQAYLRCLKCRCLGRRTESI